MTTTPDPRTVREIARKHIRSGHTDIGLTLIDHFGNGVLGDEEYDAWERAVRPVWRNELRAVSWPDEQPQPVLLMAAELAELTASIEHLSGPDAWDEDRLEPALIPVTHYVPRLLAMAAKGQPQDERDARIAQLERELRELRGTELNPSPLVLDAQAYGELRDEIAAGMGDEWDLDEAEISILIKYVRWLAAGQPRDEDGYPVRRETYPVAETGLDELRRALSAAYRERAHLVALLAAVYPSHIGRTDPDTPDWAVVTLQLPTGQAAWHISADDEDLFEHVEHDPENAIAYDGHSTVEKYGRIDDLAAEIAAAQEAVDPDVMAVPCFEIERLEQAERDADVRPDAFDLDCEELVEIFAEFIGEWDRSHEVISVGLPDHLPQLRIPHLRRAVVALQRLGRERDAALEARDADARTVAKWIATDDEDVPAYDFIAACVALRRRFADRIAALEARNAKATPTTGWILWDADGRWIGATTSPSDNGWRSVSINDAEAQEWQQRNCILDRMDEAGWRAYNEGDKARWQFDPGSRDVWLKAKGAER